jgi:predicted transcriptional regulator
MKKTELITFRTDEATKEALAKIAQSKKWSISLLVEDIVQQWLQEQQEQKQA